MNSFYGWLGARFAHLVNLDIASAVTKQGRGLIMLCKRTAEQGGHTVAYGDTDSIFVVQEAHENEQHARALAHTINGELGRMHAAGVNLEYEKIYRPLLLMKRKKYAGLLEGKLSVSGLACKRTDGFPIQNQVQADILHKLLSFQDVAALDAYRAALRHIQLQPELTMRDFTRTAALTKPIEEYARPLPVHAAVAERIGGFAKGDRIAYIVTQGHGTVAERAASPDAAKNKELDRAYYATLLQQLD